MSVRLRIEPEDPGAGDAIHIFVHGEVDVPATVTVTSDDGINGRSTVFTQGVMPPGTGPDAFELTIAGSAAPDFVLSVYEYGDEDGPVATDPIYHYVDGNDTYPLSDDIINALEGALGGRGVTVNRDGALLTVLLGGDFNGKDYILTGDTGVTVTDVDTTSGPYQWGPLVLTAGDYVIDVVDADDDSIADDTVEITVA